MCRDEMKITQKLLVAGHRVGVHILLPEGLDLCRIGDLQGTIFIVIMIVESAHLHAVLQAAQVEARGCGSDCDDQLHSHDRLISVVVNLPWPMMRC